MLKASLTKFGSDAAVSAPPEGVHVPAAKGNHSGLLGWLHVHKEWNFRKQPLGMKAYSKKHMDIYAPFGFTAPMRHVETPFPGAWMAGGHKPHPKYMRHGWNIAWRIAIPAILGIPVGCIGWYRKVIHLGQWEIKNAGAVTGME